MAALEDFNYWIQRDITRFAGIGNAVQVFGGDMSPEECGTIIRIYTDTNYYTIKATEKRDAPGYLGCTASSRKPRAGEDWTRGNDLHDGPLSEETWHRILGDIVSFEMVRIAKRAKSAPVCEDEGVAV